MDWVRDFLLDTFAQAQQIKYSNILDEYTGECLAIDVAGAIRSNRVIDLMSRRRAFATCAFLAL